MVVRRCSVCVKAASTRAHARMLRDDYKPIYVYSRRHRRSRQSLLLVECRAADRSVVLTNIEMFAGRRSFVLLMNE